LGLVAGPFLFFLVWLLSLTANAKTLTCFFPLFRDSSSLDTAALVHLASHSCVSIRDSSTTGVSPGCSSFELVESIKGSPLGTAKTTCLYRGMLEHGGQGGEMVVIVAVKANEGNLDWVVDLNCGTAEVVDSGIVVCVTQVFVLFLPPFFFMFVYVKEVTTQAI
jgi:hypothetical protein